MNILKYARARWLCIVSAACAFLLLAAGLTAGSKSLPKQIIKGANHASIELSLSGAEFTISSEAPNLVGDGHRVYLAIGSHGEIGSAVLPFQRAREGSTVFLPFKADQLISAPATAGSKVEIQKWAQWKWSPPQDAKNIKMTVSDGRVTFQIPKAHFNGAARIDLVVYAKDLSKNDGWGDLFSCSDPAVLSGGGDRYIPHFLEINLSATDDKIASVQARLSVREKIRIYQLFVRLFGNTNDTRKEDGTLADNGVGKFEDINDAALKSIHALGFNHVWLTGVLQQATATDYSEIGQPADDADLLKGLAGSPYAIKDYFDVSPDYARDPSKRLEEFKSLLDRVHKNGMKALIDLVANHVARSYNSDIKPDQNFGSRGNDGKGDDTSVFFSPSNNFFYLKPDNSGPPLHLPTLKDGQVVSPTCKAVAALAEHRDATDKSDADHKPPLQPCDGLFDGEKEHGKVTGNNKVSWKPDLGDWYETVKLNYGFDFTVPDKSVREYPNAAAPAKAIPDTWKKVDSIIAYWQGIGVDGFRCDMSHMVPPEFWNWAIARARSRHANVVFIGEAYDNDPAKVPGMDPVIAQLNGGKSNVMFDLLNAGFNAVYDDPTYRAIKKIYEGPGWANDIDGAQPDAFIFDNSLRYAENHDEVRLAAPSQWRGLGAKVGPPVSAILYGLSRGPAMMYNGQEVGEPGAGVEGFGGDDARTSIFDYWSMPELVKWVNQHKYDGEKLSDAQKELRETYGRIVSLVGEPAFRDGAFIPLNAANRDNPGYGRVGSEQPSGHWLYSFLRYDAHTGQRFLVVANLHPTSLIDDIRIRIPDEAIRDLGLAGENKAAMLELKDRIVTNEADATAASIGEAMEKGIPVAEMRPLTARYFEIKVAAPAK